VWQEINRVTGVIDNVQTVVRGSTWSPPSPSAYSPTQPGAVPMSVAQSNRLQPRSGDYSHHDGPSRSPPYRQPPTRYTDSPYAQYPAGSEQPYRGPPSEIVDRREYRDVPEFGRNGYRGHGSLPRDSSLPYHPSTGNRPSSALPDQFHPHHPYMTSPRAPPSQQQPQYSNGSYNGPAVMESPPRPGVNRETDDKERLYQQTVSANQQYERVSLL